MRKGFFVSSTLLLLAGFTLLLGIGVSEVVKEANQDCIHSARIFLRDINSGLLWMEIEANQNISNRVRYEEMPYSLTMQTDEDIVYLRDDNEMVYGYLTSEEFKVWLGCKKDV